MNTPHHTYPDDSTVPAYPDTTYCNKCGHLLRFYEYAILDSCPRCGHSLVRNYYIICVGYALLALLFCAVEYFRQPASATLGTVLLGAGFAWTWAIAAIGLDLLLRVLSPMDKALRRSVGGWISFLVALALLFAAYDPVNRYFHVPADSLRQTLLASLLLSTPPAWLSLALNILGGILLWYAAFLFAISARIGRGSLLGKILLTLRMTLNSRKCIIITGSVAAILIGAFKPWLGELAAGLPRLFVLGIGAVSLIRALLPASVLFLAASCDHGRTMLRTLHRAGYPLRVAHLLNIAGAGMPELNASQVRVFSNWRKAVDAFSDAVSVIVLDLRVRTPHIHTELQTIFRRHLLGKTIFVVDARLPDMSLFPLYSIAAAGDTVFLASPEMLEDAIRDLGRSALHGPIPRPFDVLVQFLTVKTFQGGSKLPHP